MSSNEVSYHYCGSADPHCGVRCINHWVSERQKFLDTDTDTESNTNTDTDTDTESNTMDKFEQNRRNWANFKKSLGKKSG